MSKLYYILDTRQIVGNCLLWWGKDRKGYVCSLDEAGLYSEAEAMSQQRSRGTDVAIPKEVAERGEVRHVRETPEIRGLRESARKDHDAREREWRKSLPKPEPKRDENGRFRPVWSPE